MLFRPIVGSCNSVPSIRQESREKAPSRSTDSPRHAPPAPGRPAFLSSICHVPAFRSAMPLPIVGYRITHEQASWRPLTRSCGESNGSPKTFLQHDSKCSRASERLCGRAPMYRVLHASLGSSFGARASFRGRARPASPCAPCAPGAKPSFVGTVARQCRHRLNDRHRVCGECFSIGRGRDFAGTCGLNDPSLQEGFDRASSNGEVFLDLGGSIRTADYRTGVAALRRIGTRDASRCGEQRPAGRVEHRGGLRDDGFESERTRQVVIGAHRSMGGFIHATLVRAVLRQLP